MLPLDAQLQALIEPALAHAPDADPAVLGAHFIDQCAVGAALDATWDQLGPTARAFVTAHGDWGQWEDGVIAVLAQSPESAAVAKATLGAMGWVDEDGAFPLSVRAWRKARRTPDPEMVQRAADAAEAAFHHFRYAGAGDVEARAAVERWGAWSTVPEVAQWAAIARQESLGDTACPRCRVWAALEESRATQWRGWEDQAARWLDRAAALASTPAERFFVAFLGTIRAVQAGEPGSASRVEQLADAVSTEADWLFVHQARSVLAAGEHQDATPPLRHAISLAQRLDLPFREVHLRILLATAVWPDGRAMFTELEQIEIEASQLTDRDRWNLIWTWTRAHLAAGDIQEAARHARRIVDDPALAALNAGSAWSVIAVAHRRAGELEDAERALLEARRQGAGRLDDRLLTWAESAWDGKDGLPQLAFVTVTAWVTRDGRCFRVDGETVALDHSPVSVTLLRELVQGPRTADALIDSCWPNDASDYLSLRNRLHSAIRTLRRRGLEPHLVFSEGSYRLEGLRIIGPIG